MILRGDVFGVSTSISGDTVVIGAWSEDDPGNYSGAAYVFTRTNGVWTEQQKLESSDIESGDAFGISTSISGDTVVIGAYGEGDPGTNSGAAYVFTRTNGVWTEQQKLESSDIEDGDVFGVSTSISGDTVVIGAYGEGDLGTYSGAAYVFTRTNGVWTEQQKLESSDIEDDDRFGYSTSISGDTVVIGAYREDDPGTNSGAAYVFTRTNGVWTEQQKLESSDIESRDWFGYSTSISGDTVVIGAYGEGDPGTSTGAAYVFDLTDIIPDTYTLTPNTDSNNSTVQDSNTITIGGLDNGVTVSVAVTSTQPVMVKKNIEPFVDYVADSITVVNGDTLQLRMTAPASVDLSYTATMTIGGVSSQWVVSTVANSAPAVTGIVPVDVSVTSGETVNITVPTDLFTDADGHAIVITYPGLPSFLSETGGVISGTPNLGELGDYSVLIQATDELGAKNSVMFTVHVTVPTFTDGVDGDDFNGDARLTALEAVDHFDPRTTSVTLGAQSKAGSYSVSVGLRAESGKFATAVGLDSDAAAFRSVALGNNATTEERYEVRLGGETFERSTGLFAGRGFVTVHPNQAGLETRDNELVSKKWADTQIAILLARIEALEHNYQ